MITKFFWPQCVWVQIVPFSRPCLVHTQIPSMVTPTRSQQDNLRADSQEPAILSRKRHKELNCFLAGGFCDSIPISQTDDHSWFHFTVASLEWHVCKRSLVLGDLHHLVEWDSVKVPLSLPHLLCHRAAAHRLLPEGLHHRAALGMRLRKQEIKWP